MDSTGIAAIDTQGAHKIFKRAYPSVEFMQFKDYDKTLNWGDNVYIGHNRAATRGAVNHANAHPFHTGKIVGVHNGTLRGAWRLPDEKYYDVDSECLLNAIDTLGVDEAWKITDGAAALAWWNLQDKTLNLLRNNERTLFYAYSKDFKTLLWASEWEMMTWCASRNKIDLQDPLEIPPNVLHTFTVPLGFAATAKEFEKVRVRQLSPFVQPSCLGYQRRNDAGSGNRGGNVGNVSPFPRKKIITLPGSHTTTGQNSTQEIKTFKDNLFEEHKEFFDKWWDVDIEFIPVSRGTTQEGNVYWHCTTPFCKDINLRVCLSFQRGSGVLLDKDSLEIDRLLETKEKMSGLLKSGIKFSQDAVPLAFLRIEKSTIQISAEEDGPPEDEDNRDGVYVPTYSGRMLNFKEFTQAVKHGCGVCSIPPSFEEATDLEWTAPDTFICKECQSLPFVQDFMNIGNISH